ncbi:MAG: hypothetical protein KGD63_14465 [Candidatus Lokiarchaeota archaeon]|nr:hypothetical protein [Candidatus Lokiarchaeota archaeon]
MTLIDKSILSSDIKDSIELFNIHYLFVFNRAGICLYSRNFTNQYRMNDNLLSAFCSAIISFSQEMVGKKLKTVDMNSVKIVIFQRDIFFYGFLCDIKQDMETIKDYVNKIDDCLRNYVIEKKINTNVECIRDENINAFIDNLVRNKTIQFSKKKEIKFLTFLKNLHMKNDIEGMVLLTNKDRIVYSSINPIKLKQLLNKLDFRIKIYNNSILRLFFTLEKEIIYTEYIDDSYFIILLFDIKTQFGIVEHTSRKIINSLKKLE